MRLTCAWCGEGIVDDEIPPQVRASMSMGPPDPNRDLHMACAIRSVVGSIGHQMGLCDCPGNPGLIDDPPGATKREAARMAKAYYDFHLTGVMTVDLLAMLASLALPRGDGGATAASSDYTREELSVATEREAIVAGHLRLIREVAGRHAVEWLMDDENDELVRRLRAMLHDQGGGPEAIAIVADMIHLVALQAVTPDGGFPLPAGPRLGLLCRLLEVAMNVVDWEWVAREVTANHIEGGS